MFDTYRYNYRKYFATWPTKTSQGWIFRKPYYELFSPFTTDRYGNILNYGKVDEDKFLLLMLEGKIGDDLDVRHKRNHR